MELADTSTEEILKKLISIPSYSGKEKGVLEYVASFLKEEGIDFEVLPVERDRWNILSLSSETLVSVHVDTVPPIDMGAKATRPKERDGKICGRGASDVKGGVAALLGALRKFRRRLPDRAFPLSMAFVVDEESNSALGSERLIPHLKGIKSVLVLEPTYGKLGVSQMGTLEFSLEARCPSFHASEFEGVLNPIKLLFRLVDKLERALEREVNLLMLKGGWRYYATPKLARALLEVKLFRGERFKDVETKIKEVLKEAQGCKLTYRCEDYEEFIDFRCGAILERFKGAYRNVMGKSPELYTMPSWTDAANFHRAGLECLVFGFGSLRDSHTEREAIPVSDLTNFRDTLYEFAKIHSL